MFPRSCYNAVFLFHLMTWRNLKCTLTPLSLHVRKYKTGYFMSQIDFNLEIKHPALDELLTQSRWDQYPKVSGRWLWRRQKNIHLLTSCRKHEKWNSAGLAKSKSGWILDSYVCIGLHSVLGPGNLHPFHMSVTSFLTDISSLRVACQVGIC